MVGLITKDTASPAPPRSPISWALIFIDTSILWLRAWARRIKKLGLSSLLRTPRMLGNPDIVYLDLGTHEQGKELALMVNTVLPRVSSRFRAFGFEASSDSFKRVSTIFAGTDRVELIWGALCREVPPTGVVRLYKHGDGHGDSLHRVGSTYEDARALRLSDWLKDTGIDVANTICILRMNIEGAEVDVMQDLVDCQLCDHIDGYYGMWDDVAKIDVNEDDSFRALLRANGVAPFTFNERDFVSKFRIQVVVFDIHTSILAASRCRRLSKT